MSEESIFSTQVQIFTLDGAKKSWIAASQGPLPLAFMKNNTSELTRIVCMDGTRAVINSTLTKGMKFKCTAASFGQWQDRSTSSYFGVKFGTEEACKQFIDIFATEANKSDERISTGSGNRGVCLYDYKGTSEKQLSFSKDDKIKNVTETAETNWSQGTLVVDGKEITGIFPSNYVSLEKKSSIVSIPSSDSVNLMKDYSTASVMIPPPIQRALSSTNIKPSEPEKPATRRDSIASTDSSNESLQVRALRQELTGLRDENEKLRSGLVKSKDNMRQWEAQLEKSRQDQIELIKTLADSLKTLEVWKKTLAIHKEQSKMDSKRMKELGDLTAKVGSLL